MENYDRADANDGIGNQDPEVPLLPHDETKPADEHTHQKTHELPIKIWGIVVADARKIRFQRIVELCGLAVAIGVLYVYYSQLDIMSKQLREMKDSGQQTNFLIFLYRQQVNKLNDQLGILSNNVKETHTLGQQTQRNGDILLSQERPWVGVLPPVTVQGKQDDGNRLSFSTSVTTQNYGRSPAMRTMFNIGFIPDADSIEMHQNIACKQLNTFANGDIWEAIAANGERSTGDRKSMVKFFGSANLRQAPKFGVVLFPGQTSTEGTITSNQRPADMNTVVYFAGCIVYWDNSNAPHKTRFCYETPGALSAFQTPSALVSCHTHNDAD